MAKRRERTQKRVPPYISYKAFLTFLEALRVAGVPTRLDRSLVPSMSGSNQALLFSTLRYLGLITEKSAPTEDLDTLVNAKGDDYQEVWHRIVLRAYSNLFDSDFDIERTTTQELTKAFARQGVSNADTVRKCVTFFTLAAKDARIKLSPHIRPYAGRKHSTRQSQQTTKEPEAELLGRSLATSKYGSREWQFLLSKFPDFDPLWPEELKTKWFDAFERFWKVLDSAKKGEDSASSA